MLKHIHLRICGEHIPDWRKSSETTIPNAAAMTTDYLEALDVQNWAAGRQRHISDGHGKPPTDR